MGMRRHIGLTLLLILLGIEIVLLTLDESKPDGERSAEAAALDPREEREIRESLTGVHMMETRHDGKGWELWADRSVRYRGEEDFHLEGIRAVFPSSEGVSFAVTGRVGVVDVDTMNMQVEGNVVIQSTNGYIFKTSFLSYSSHNRCLKSPTFIEMMFFHDKKGVPIVLKGLKMLADLDTSLVEVHDDVFVEKSLEKGGKFTVKSQRAKFSGSSHLGQFFGDVVINMDPMKVTGSEAQFKYEKGSISDVRVKGGVRANDAERWVTSEQVDIYFEDEKFVFRGKPRVVQGGDELRGEEIVFHGRGQSIQVRKVRAKIDKKSTEEIH